MQSTIKGQLIFRRPLRRKLRMRWFFDVSKVKESVFLNRTSLTLHQIFDAYLLENRVSADPQFSAQRAPEEVNRSVALGLTRGRRVLAAAAIFDIQAISSISYRQTFLFSKIAGTVFRHTYLFKTGIP